MKYGLFIIFCLASFLSRGQHMAEGRVIAEDGNPLVGSTVVFLTPGDSAMVSFAISDNDGRFLLEDLEAQTYILQITFVSYRTYFENITISNDQKRARIGSFQLEPSSELLQEVTVKAEHIPMGILGDTISYNASAFITRPGASVEDLLRKLPGVEVNRDGSIKAMGEDVENVLVDGKEFFGEDPKIATQNLDAEAVDKVELFDKQSEIAEFTGIDDGNEEKTINLKLKEEYKKGGFGNVNLNGGTDSRYEGKINYNRFSPEMQAAVILTGNNINVQPFSFNEYIQFMGGLSNAIASNNGMVQFGELGMGRAPQGLTDNISSGINFNYDFSNKLKLTSHYFYLSADREIDRTQNSSQFTDRTTFETQDATQSNNRNQNHRFQSKLEFKPNPFTQLIFKNNVYNILSDMSSMTNTLFQENGFDTGITNSSLRQNNSQWGVDSDLQIRKKYQKKGRNWISKVGVQSGKLNEESTILNEYFFNGLDNIIDQNQDYNYQKTNLILSSSYTEPLNKNTYLSASYRLLWDRERPERNFFDVVEDQSSFNEQLSREYEKINRVHTGSLSLKRNTKRYKLNLTLGSQFTTIDGQIASGTEEIRNQSFFLLPSTSLSFDITKDESIELAYRTNINLPTLNQLAPLPDNSNPNIFVIGNPNLTPEYMHRIDLGFHSIDQFNFKNFFLRTSFQSIQDRIINEVTINEQFIKTLQPQNVDDYKRVSGYMSYGAPIRALKLRFQISSQFSWSKYTTSLNGLRNVVDETNTTFNFTFENRKKDKVDIATGLRLNYNNRKYETNESFNQSFFNYDLFIDGSLFVSHDWTLMTSLEQRKFSGEFFSDQETFTIWNASIRKSFKEDKFALELKAYDLLGQNIGLSRSGNINGLFEENYNTLTRYFMLGLKVKIGRKARKGTISFG